MVVGIWVGLMVVMVCCSSWMNDLGLIGFGMKMMFFGKLFRVVSFVGVWLDMVIVICGLLVGLVVRWCSILMLFMCGMMMLVIMMFGSVWCIVSSVLNLFLVVVIVVLGREVLMRVYSMFWLLMLLFMIMMCRGLMLVGLVVIWVDCDLIRVFMLVVLMWWCFFIVF